MTEREYIDIKNMGLIVAAVAALEEVLLFDEHEIVSWDRLNEVKEQLHRWHDALNIKCLTQRKKASRETAKESV